MWRKSSNINICRYLVLVIAYLFISLTTTLYNIVLKWFSCCTVYTPGRRTYTWKYFNPQNESTPPRSPLLSGVKSSREVNSWLPVVFKILRYSLRTHSGWCRQERNKVARELKHKVFCLVWSVLKEVLVKKAENDSPCCFSWLEMSICYLASISVLPICTFTTVFT